MTKDSAVKLLQESNIPYRIPREDGIVRVITADYHTDRLNLYVEDGKVSEVYNG
jgi:hypothetical protein